MIYDNTYIKPYDEFIGCLTKEFIIEQLNKMNEITKDLIATKIVELDKSNYYIQTYREILEDRIDKAIEYINNHFLYHYGSEEKPIVFEDDYIQEITDILRGKDNEDK